MRVEQRRYREWEERLVAERAKRLMLIADCGLRVAGVGKVHECGSAFKRKPYAN